MEFSSLGQVRRVVNSRLSKWHRGLPRELSTYLHLGTNVARLELTGRVSNAHVLNFLKATAAEPPHVPKLKKNLQTALNKLSMLRVFTEVVTKAGMSDLAAQKHFRNTGLKVDASAIKTINGEEYEFTLGVWLSGRVKRRAMKVMRIARRAYDLRDEILMQLSGKVKRLHLGIKKELDDRNVKFAIRKTRDGFEITHSFKNENLPLNLERLCSSFKKGAAVHESEGFTHLTHKITKEELSLQLRRSLRELVGAVRTAEVAKRSFAKSYQCSVDNL